MRGLCTSERERFKNFFALVQEEAQKKGAIFFLESGEGNHFDYGDLGCTDLFGWLTPKADADRFEAIWQKNPHDIEALDAWYDESCFVRWEKDGGEIKIHFEF